jgi:MATE family multidrug resistance protein
MDRVTSSASRAPTARLGAPLPAQRIDAAGHAHVDQRLVLALALPLMANSAVQIILNLTDMWFMGRISTKAVGAVQWLVMVVVLVLGGAGTAVQTLVAQSFGARRYWRAGQAVWTALWAMACAAPLFLLAGSASHLILAPFGFDPGVEQLASAFWFPRVGGACVGAAVWALLGFFNGIGRPRITLVISIVTTVANALLNQLFIFRMGWGIAGSAWATNVAQVIGVLFALFIFLRPYYRREYKSHLTWRPHAGRLVQQLRLGVPMGLSPAADLLGFAIFQMMQTRLGTAGGAATQMVVILTSLAYMPGFGIASAGTTWWASRSRPGREWALRVGNRTILLAALYMGGSGADRPGGRWLLPFFTGAHDADSVPAGGAWHPAAVARGRVPVLRRPEPRQQHVPARRRGCPGACAAGAAGLAAVVRAPGARAHLCPRAGVGKLPAAVRLRCRGRLGRSARLHRRAGQHAVPALARAGMAAHTPLRAGHVHRA